MPFTRPAVISDCVSLSDKDGGRDRTFVAEGGAIDALLSAVVNELPPDKESVGASCAENKFLAGADELVSLPAVLVSIGAVMPLVQGEA